MVSRPNKKNSVESSGEQDEAVKKLSVLAGELHSAVTTKQQQEVKRRVTEVLSDSDRGLPLEEVCLLLGFPLEVIKTRRKVGNVIKLDIEKVLEEYFMNNLPSLEEDVVVNEISKVFVPPDKEEFIAGPGTKEYKAPKKYPRFILALGVLKNMNVDLSLCWFWEGKNASNMVRGLSYRVIVCPTIGKSILICDEEGNRTFVIDDISNPSKYWNMNKSELKSADGVQHFQWNNAADWTQKLTHALTTVPETTIARDTVVIGRTGVGVYEGREVVSLMPYCEHNGHTYRFLKQRSVEEGFEPLDGVKGQLFNVNGWLGRSCPVYAREQIDSILPVDIDENGIGKIDEREVVALSLYGDYLHLDGVKKHGALIHFIKGKIEPIPKRLGTRSTGHTNEIYWKDEVDAILPLQLGDDGVVKIPIPDTSPVEYLDAVGLNKYADAKGISVISVYSRVEEAAIKPIDGVTVNSGKQPIEVYRKEEVDICINDLLLDKLVDGIVELDGVEYVGLQAYGSALGLARTNFEAWIKSTGLLPVPGKFASSGVHKVELYNRSEVDELVRIRLPESGITTVKGKQVVGLSRYAEYNGIDPSNLKRYVKKTGLEPYDTGQCKVLSSTAQVDVYLKKDIDIVIELMRES
ncbi:hypothetical protein ACFL2V_08310 [Pseudomonadota bacterium]